MSRKKDPKLSVSNSDRTLKRITPRDEKGRTKHRYFQRLTENVGHPRLRARSKITSHFNAPIHPAWLRSSSVK